MLGKQLQKTTHATVDSAPAFGQCANPWIVCQPVDSVLTLGQCASLDYSMTEEEEEEQESCILGVRVCCENQVGWNVGQNLSIGGRELPYSGTNLKGIVTDVQV